MPNDVGFIWQMWCAFRANGVNRKWDWKMLPPPHPATIPSSLGTIQRQTTGWCGVPGDHQVPGSCGPPPCVRWQPCLWFSPQTWNACLHLFWKASGHFPFQMLNIKWQCWYSQTNVTLIFVYAMMLCWGVLGGRGWVLKEILTSPSPPSASTTALNVHELFSFISNFGGRKITLWYQRR